MKTCAGGGSRQVRMLLAGLAACGGGFGYGLGAVGGMLGVIIGGHVGLRDEAEGFAQFVLDLITNLDIFLKEDAGIFASLAEALTFVGNPGAGFFEQAFG